jgi:hypothetical protein
MIKTFVATGFSCLAVGSILGYTISELTRQPQTLQAQPTQQPTQPTETKASRKELEDRYLKALDGFKLTIDTKELKVFTDRQLNDEVYRLESLLKAGKPYTAPS